MSQNVTTKQVRSFLGCVLRDDPENENSLLVASFTRRIPDDLTENPGHVLRPTHAEAMEFRRLLTAMDNDPLMEHLSHQQKEDHLWHLYCRLKLQEPSVRGINAIAEKFLSQHSKEWNTYDCLICVKGITPDKNPFQVGKFTIVKLGPKFLDGWGLRERRQSIVWRGYAGVNFTVRAGDLMSAFQRARSECISFLQDMRYGIQQPIRFRIYNEQLLFPSPWAAASERPWGNRNVIGGGINDYEREQISSWTTQTLARASEALLPLNQLRTSGRRDLAERANLALDWLSIAREATRTELAVLAAMAAIESLLSSIRDRRKGENIAVRDMLLDYECSGSFSEPQKFLEVYLHRSSLTHGSTSHSTEESARYLINRVHDILTDYLKFCESEPTIRKHSQFLQRLDDSKHVAGVRKWLREWGYEDVEEAVWPSDILSCH